MKKTKSNALTIVELLDINRDTLARIKRKGKGYESLCWNPLYQLNGFESWLLPKELPYINTKLCLRD
jgi:hypothetical protein